MITYVRVLKKKKTSTSNLKMITIVHGIVAWA